MQTLSDIVAAVVVSSSAAAYSHFGVTLETKVEPPRAERVITRTPQAPKAEKVEKVEKIQKARASDAPCPDEAAKAIKA